MTFLRRIHNIEVFKVGKKGGWCLVQGKRRAGGCGDSGHSASALNLFVYQLTFAAAAYLGEILSCRAKGCPYGSPLP